MAHNNWYTLEKLIQILDAHWIDIYLHIDSKANDFCEEKFLNIPKFASIQLTKRHNVTWGNESQITAEMTLFKAAYCNGPYHYYHFISGSDLPLYSAQEIYDFFEDKNCNFLHTEDNISLFEWRLKTYVNIFRCKWIPTSVRKRLNTISWIIQNKLNINRLHWLKSRYPILGKGHNWCDLTQMAVAELLKAEKDIRKFTRFTHCSDEMYKQIILLNQSSEIIGPITDIDIRYIDWSENGDHPRTLTMQNYEYLCSHTPAHHIFARKFDDQVDREVIDKIYNKICNF